MTLKAIFLGSIGSVAETSNIQRCAYNKALAEMGVNWSWDQSSYRDLLSESGGQDRLRKQVDADGNHLSSEQIAAIHARKTELACAQIVAGIELRPGVAELIEQASLHGIRVAMVTSTYRQNIEAIAKGAGGKLPLDKLSAVMTVEDCEFRKPAPDVYLAALQELNVEPSEVIAIEDSQPSVASAVAAGIYTIATPGEFTAKQQFGAADRVIDSLQGVTITELERMVA